MRRCNHEALAQSVQDAWNFYLSEKAFKNVHGRLQVVMQCILEGDGGNDLVEEKRGKLFRDATIIDLHEEGEERELEGLVGRDNVVHELIELQEEDVDEDDCSL